MFKPYMMKNVDMIIGDEATPNNFKCQVRGVTLNPDVSIQRIKTACPTGQYADADDPEWTCELKYLYGMDDGSGTAATILADYLLANSRQELPITFRPTAGGAGYSGTIIAIPGPIGGDYGSYSEQTVQLPMIGQPVPIAAGV